MTGRTKRWLRWAAVTAAFWAVVLQATEATHLVLGRWAAAGVLLVAAIVGAEPFIGALRTKFEELEE